MVKRYAQALSADDFDAQDSLENYPSRVEAGTTPSVDRIIGMDDEFIPRTSGLGWGILHVAGSGDEFQMTGKIRYPDGQTWQVVVLLTLRNGQIWRETDYFAAPFEPPGWRSQYVEIDEELRSSSSA